ncbi:8175_t:CDS:10 [Acaulospora morrowiae]|uniref:non-specific serine/threonine protein kinase n=1 Tax=Acaulospora morrowiae TaxID=94023 RepID=A0A9N9G550_9GLOM|nr:8175_t:CDS:10 [Acaulospora morrowiae]
MSISTESDEFFLNAHRGTRSRRNTFAYGDSGGSQLPQGQISSSSNELVPYSKDWTVILRNENAGQLVLYNAANRRFSVRRLQQNDTSSTVQAFSTPHSCYMCGRPFDASHTKTPEPDFMARNYFRLLENSESSNLGPGITRERSSSSSLSETFSHQTFTPTTEIPASSDNIEDPPTLSQSSFNQGYYERFFIEEKKLGRGYRGSVYLCKHVLDNVPLGEYAIKKVAVGDNHAWLARMLREVHLLEKLRHPNIVEYKHAWLEYHQLTNFGPQVPCLFILMERANGGNLEEYIDVQPQLSFEQDSGEKLTSMKRKLRAKRMRHADHMCEEPSTSTSPVISKRLLDVQEINLLFMNICEGLAHLHQQGIVHRDLKPSNLLLHYNDPNNRVGIPRILISDFGECEILDELTDRDRTGATGTLEFMAPELLTVDDRGLYLKDYSPKSDMWSLGMVLHYLCYSRLPYRQVEDVDLLKDEILHFQGNSIRFSEYDASIRGTSNERRIPLYLRSLITRLLSRNSKDRPSCEEILNSIGEIKSTFRESVNEPLFADLPSMSDGEPQVSTASASVDSESEFSKLSGVVFNNHLEIEQSDPASETSSSKLVVDNEQLGDDNIRRRKKKNGTHEIAGSDVSQSNAYLNVEREVIIGQSPAVVQNIPINGSSAAMVRLMPASRSMYFPRIIYSYIFENGGFWKIAKILIFLLKITTCTSPCSPFLPSPWVFYPILIFAILDLLVKKGKTHLMLGFAHVLLISTFAMRGRLCENRAAQGDQNDMWSEL